MNDFNTSNVTVIRDRTTEKPAGRQYFNTSNVTVIPYGISDSNLHQSNFNTSNVTVIQHTHKTQRSHHQISIHLMLLLYTVRILIIILLVSHFNTSNVTVIPALKSGSPSTIPLFQYI